jgi:hypothetical protein
VKTMRESKRYRSTIQSEKLLALLRSAHGGWVSLPDILALGLAQYNARIWDLRNKRGLNIENRTEIIKGVRHSWFRLLDSPAPSASQSVKEKTNPANSATSTSSDWYERSVGKPRPSGDTSDLPLFDLAVRP